MANYIKKVAIVGATGTVGKFIVSEILKKGKQQVTAITRADSKAVMPAGVAVANVSYNDPATLEAAMRGHDALVITLGTSVPKDTQNKLITAAAAAGVSFVLPNEWGIESDVGTFGADVLLGNAAKAARARIEELGKSSWISVHTGYWYAHSAAIPDAFGMDWKNKTMTFFDEGTQKINVITQEKTGRVVASLLSLPIEPETPGASSLGAYRNKHLFTSSWLVSQQDMFDSVLRVTGTNKADWTIQHESSKQRHEEAKAHLFKTGDHSAFAKVLYARTFYPNDDGNFWTRHTSDDERIGLVEPEEDLDAETKKAINLMEAGYKYGA
ncbi:putative oxidoreductase CipA [Xylariaceae sp. FL0255]|nr:putative oxidoreductase CipA [Xylariaceae sp. FL0255]